MHVGHEVLSASAQGNDVHETTANLTFRGLSDGHGSLSLSVRLLLHYTSPHN